MNTHTDTSEATKEERVWTTFILLAAKKFDAFSFIQCKERYQNTPTFIKRIISEFNPDSCYCDRLKANTTAEVQNT